MLVLSFQIWMLLNIEFWVNHEPVVDKYNAEVYKGDEITIRVDHPNFESVEKTYD
jgi:hypothetical protein